MHYCIQTLLAGGEEVEILIINDDKINARITRANIPQPTNNYRAIHQENKRSGPWIQGMANATGSKQEAVDSDDWVGVRAYLNPRALITTLWRNRRRSRCVYYELRLWRRRENEENHALHFHFVPEIKCLLGMMLSH